MSVLEYKGYQGSVTYEDRVLRIEVLHVSDFLLAECHDTRNVESTFQELINDYLKDCEALGREPNKPYKGSFNVRVSPELHRQIAMASKREGVSLNAWIVGAVAAQLLREQTSAQLLSRYAILGERPGRRKPKALKPRKYLSEDLTTQLTKLPSSLMRSYH